jgi:hypothetical protein
MINLISSITTYSPLTIISQYSATFSQNDPQKPCHSQDMTMISSDFAMVFQAAGSMGYNYVMNVGNTAP